MIFIEGTAKAMTVNRAEIDEDPTNLRLQLHAVHRFAHLNFPERPVSARLGGW